MIEKAKSGEVEYIITKSISRFARNTVDTLTTIRMLKSIGIGVWFEKEGIDTLDAKGEFVITLMSSLGSRGKP
ncbi:recombinase family protein [Lactococcus lactis]|uniref:recombinase family protein n=1 Tax=Lactococcus TaxID=1357 RepID=UPI00223BF386|nr:recombinase family protein [Lactococcus lactis]MDQ7159696.1 recombinase family protein [Lactococcus lactis]